MIMNDFQQNKLSCLQMCSKFSFFENHAPVKRLQPFWVRRLRIFLPPTVLRRSKNPCFRFLRIMEGWKVRLMCQIQEEKASKILLLKMMADGCCECSSASVVTWHRRRKKMFLSLCGNDLVVCIAVCRIRLEASMELTMIMTSVCFFAPSKRQT